MSRFLSKKKRSANKSRQWHSVWSKDETLSYVKKLATWHAEQAGPEGKYIADCINSDRFLPLCNYDIEYVDGRDPQGYQHLRQALAYYSKLEFLELGIDKKQEAINTWLWAESECIKTNSLFDSYESGKFTFSYRNADVVLHNARRKISFVLGEVPCFEALNYRFGPGATTLTKKRDASIARKLATRLSCSSDFLPYASRVLEELPHLCDLHNVGEDHSDIYKLNIVVEKEVVRFVPKSAKTYRSISVMPSLNGLIQLALGDVIGRRLKSRAHIDITDQTLNQELARLGSVDGVLSTIDLKSASDTLSIGLVSHLLPFEWLIALDSCRSEVVNLEGKEITIAKYSSQGNGYTFPLQTLIFWALASSVSELYGQGIVSVYGDDIIVPSVAFNETCECLSAFGFTPNKSKSFTGCTPFRESCGADYYRGFNIRPKYVKDKLSFAAIFELHNFYRRQHNDVIADVLLETIPQNLRLFGPDGFGDGVLLGDFVPQRKRSHIRNGYGGFVFQSYRLKPRKEKGGRYCSDTEYVANLYELYRSSRPQIIEPEGLVGNGVNFLKYFKGINAAPIQRYPTSDSVRSFDLPGSDGSEKVLIYTF